MLPRKLPTFVHEGKVWTVDIRLREFRFVEYGELPEFIPFESEEGEKMLRAMEHRQERARQTSILH
jgi:hypothetical protein